MSKNNPKLFVSYFIQLLLLLCVNLFLTENSDDMRASFPANQGLSDC